MTRREIQDDRVAWVMAWLNDRGATFVAVEGRPGWYAALYTMPNGEAKRWTCSHLPNDVEQAFALAFRARVERAAEPLDIR